MFETKYKANYLTKTNLKLECVFQIHLEVTEAALQRRS